MDAERYAATKALLEHLYALTGTGQWDKVEELLTEDFRIVEAETLPFDEVVGPYMTWIFGPQADTGSVVEP